MHKKVMHRNNAAVYQYDRSSITDGNPEKEKRNKQKGDIGWDGPTNKMPLTENVFAIRSIFVYFTESRVNQPLIFLYTTMY